MGGGENKTPLGRMNVNLGRTLLNVLGLGDGESGGEGGGTEISEMELRYGWLDR